MDPSGASDSMVAPILSSNRPSISDPQQSNVNAIADPTTSTSTSKTSTGQHGPPPVMQHSEFVGCCQTGNLDRIKELVEKENVDINALESDETTALHWAAINNRMSICLYLLEHGAQVDARGGELQATPLHWACKYGLVYIVHLLLQHGADPLRTDSQGFNALHLAVHSSNVLLVIYLLHEGIAPDYTDPLDRTALHWAAYQGDSLTVDALLKWGADIAIRDSLGFIPLHWAIVKGNRVCIKRLIEEGSDLSAVSNEGKSVVVMAEEMNTKNAYYGALKDCGRNPDGTLWRRYLSKRAVDTICFLSPTLLLTASLYFYTLFNAILASIAAAVLNYVYFKVLTDYVITNAYFGDVAIIKTPFYAGLFCGTCLLVWFNYFVVVLPLSFSQNPLTNFAFVFFFVSACVCFAVAMSMDPGYIPKQSGVTEQRRVIETLLEHGEYDSAHFCLATYVRKPVRAKYDKSSGRVVARFDHSCPWINNAVGLRNHRYFVIYVLSLFCGIPLLLYLFFGPTINIIVSYAEPGNEDSSQCSGSFFVPLCQGSQYVPFATVLMIWSAFQLLWILLLVFSQLLQTAKGMTTFEMISRDSDRFSSLPQDHHVHNHRAMLADMAMKKSTGCFSSLKRLLGVDVFVTAATSLGGNSSKPSPTDHGVVRNCLDFWGPAGNYNLFSPPEGLVASLGGQTVDYATLWEFPDKFSTTRQYELLNQV